jgi:hypothetical protein
MKFDLIRASFMLIAAVIGTELFLITAGAMACIGYAVWHGKGLAECRDQDFTGLLADVLAVALAFFGMHMAKDKE